MSKLSGIQASWAKVPDSARTLISAGGVLLLLVLLTVFLLLPSLKVLRYATSDHQSLDAQLDAMRGMAEQAQSLKSAPKASHDEALKFLETSVKERLATTAQLSVSGDRATVSLNNTPPEAMVAWLNDARSNGRLLPAEARLTRAEKGWNGQLVLNLPAK